MLELRWTRQKGQAIHAIQTVPRGTIIFSEAPLLETTEDTAAAVEEAFQDLSVIKQEAYLKLHRVILSKNDIPERTRESPDSNSPPTYMEQPSSIRHAGSTILAPLL